MDTATLLLTSDGRANTATRTLAGALPWPLVAAVFAANAYVDAQAPWALRKTDPARMAAVLGTLATTVAQLAAVVKPIVPASIARLEAYLEEGRVTGKLSPPQPIFPRLELVEPC